MQTGAVSISADSWGTPLPATTLVIQMLPFPIPHLIPSAPLLIKCYAPYPVAMDPETMSIEGNFYFNYYVALIANLEWPLATSTIKTSHPDLVNYYALYK